MASRDLCTNRAPGRAALAVRRAP